MATAEADPAPPGASVNPNAQPDSRQQQAQQAGSAQPRAGKRDQTEEDQPPASPPLPTKHTAVTAGPRASRLQELFASSLHHTLAKVSWENVASCYPTIAAHAPGTLKAVRKQMVERLEQLCEKEFNLILENRTVVPKLNELESLVSDAARRRSTSPATTSPIPPHLLPANEVLHAHLAPHLASQQSHLNAKLQNTQAQNEALFTAIQAQRAELAALLANVENVLRDVEEANGQLEPLVEELAKEARDVEVEMGGT